MSINRKADKKHIFALEKWIFLSWISNAIKQRIVKGNPSFMKSKLLSPINNYHTKTLRLLLDERYEGNLWSRRKVR